MNVRKEIEKAIQQRKDEEVRYVISILKSKFVSYNNQQIKFRYREDAHYVKRVMLDRLGLESELEVVFNSCCLFCCYRTYILNFKKGFLMDNLVEAIPLLEQEGNGQKPV
jgi:hypothetical protein